jgi:hypothetical protein
MKEKVFDFSYFGELLFLRYFTNFNVFSFRTFSDKYYLVSFRKIKSSQFLPLKTNIN